VTSAEPLLSVRQVSRSFGGLRALNTVSLELRSCEILGLIGPNGAGKTTLFSVIAGYLRPDSGSVYLDGAEIDGRAPETIARRGMVKTFQTSRPFGSMTFLQNVVVAALSKTRDMKAAAKSATACLAQVGLMDRAEVAASGASTGQRKRLEIARALATEPRVLLLDEPFGGVDVGAIDSLVALLHELREKGLTLLVIEHNIEAVHRLVDRVVAMDLGEVIAEGSAEAVTRNEQVVRAYMGSGDE
jgi:branched-chain amino acid transport system ATP-binding protein